MGSKEALAKVKDRTLEIRLTDLAPPPETYFADQYSAEAIDRVCYFRFGKLDVRRKQLFSVLELVATQESARHTAATFESSTSADGSKGGRFDDLLLKNLDDLGLKPYDGEGQFISRMVDSTKQHSASVSLAVLGYAEDSAALNFYRIPFAIRPGMEVPIIPVVRVETTMQILASYCRDVRLFAGKEKL